MSEVARIQSTARALRLCEKRVRILLHALGIHKHGSRWRCGGWRNRYSTHRNADGFALCQKLEADGWMRSFADGEASTFRVSPAGIAALDLCGWWIESDSQ